MKEGTKERQDITNLEDWLKLEFKTGLNWNLILSLPLKILPADY